MISELMSKYLRRSTNDDAINENMRKLEDLTIKLTSSCASESSLMNIILEFNNNGVVGFKQDGKIVFSNSNASKISKLDNIKGKSIFDVLNGNSSKLRAFIDSQSMSGSIKIEMSNNGTMKIFDVVLFRIQNGETWYVMFFIDCLENVMFKRNNCPLKDKCPLNEECEKMSNQTQRENHENCNSI